MNKNKLIKYLSCFIVGIFFTFLTIMYYKSEYNLFEITDKNKLYAYYSDIFLVPSAILISVGIIVVVSDEGFFDFFGYCLSCFKYVFKPNREGKEKFFEYHERKKEKRKNNSPWYCLFTGLIFLVPTLIFTILWYLS